MIVRVKGVKRYKHPRTGIWYSYHRASGIRVEPPFTFGTGAFFEALRAAEERHTRKKPIVGTWGALVRSYRQAHEFELLKPRTKSDYLMLLDWLKGIDQMPIHQIDTPFIVKMRDKAFKVRKRKFANYLVQIVSVVFSHAVERGLAKINPARGVKKVKRPTDAPVANFAWTEDEKRIVLERAPAHMIAPIAIARWTGLRQGDVVTLSRAAYSEGALRHTTGKRSIPLWFPCPKPLREILDALPPHNGTTLCV